MLPRFNTGRKSYEIFLRIWCCPDSPVSWHFAQGKKKGIHVSKYHSMDFFIGFLNRPSFQMAASDDDDVLQTSPERENFYRLTTLLIAGGTDIMRRVFDRKHRPQTLGNVLAKCKSNLNLKWLSRPQRELLFPPLGTAANSRNFDITLLFTLLRSICGLEEPRNGWDELPDDEEKSLEADLARLKYYRNEIYAHSDGRMEIGDAEFEEFWKDISAALLRIAGTIDAHKVMKLKMTITSFRTGPLESKKLNGDVEKLREWYLAERAEVTRSINNLEQTTIEEHQKTRDEISKSFQAFSERSATQGAAASSNSNTTNVYHGPVNIVNNYSFCGASPRTHELSGPPRSPHALSMESRRAIAGAPQSSPHHNQGMVSLRVRFVLHSKARTVHSETCSFEHLMTSFTQQEHRQQQTCAIF